MRSNPVNITLGLGLLCALLGAAPALAQNAPAAVSVNATASQHAINPLIYGVAFGDPATLNDLKCKLNREGGNNTSSYNWELNADNRCKDWYWESLPYPSAVPGEWVDSIIGVAKGAGADSMITVPMLPYMANLGAGRSPMWSFSIAKYGPQTDSDAGSGLPDAGDGISTAAGNPFIVGNNPLDAYVDSDFAVQQGWIQHLVGKWGQAAAGGVKYYNLDNEPTIWFSDHRDVSPAGTWMADIRNTAINFAEMIKGQDPTAKVVGFNEWGWPGLFDSGHDQQTGDGADRALHGGQDYYPYLLDQFHQHDVAAGKRYLDLLTIHWYPQSGEFWPPMM